MPPRKERPPQFTPLGAIKRPDAYQSSKERKMPTHEQRQKTVRVVWDLNTTPLHDAHNNYTYDAKNLRDSINQGLRQISPNLEVEPKMFAVCFRRSEAFSRFFHCQKKLCKMAGHSAKQNPEVFTGVQEQVLGDVIERESPGIILLISADSDFIPALKFLREHGFVVLLAQAEDSGDDFRNEAHYTDVGLFCFVISLRMFSKASELTRLALKQNSGLVTVDALTKLSLSLDRAQGSFLTLDVLRLVVMHMVKTEVGTCLASNYLFQVCDRFVSNRNSPRNVVKPDTVLFNLLLGSCVRFGYSLKGQELIELMAKVEVIADAYRFVIMSCVYEINGMQDELKKFKEHTGQEEQFTEHEPMIPGNCSAPMLEMEKSNMFVEERNGEPEGTLNDTTSIGVPPSAVEESSEHKVAAAALELASATSG
ncbi:unnamed protein product [Arabis nemorensis]|uniref:NYN domain-containing protein n=1 Tax=Arabis nemorensis TaxID=586526 RepID=A0A565CF26_9BRAS|nr:unnamed protein product [Arabis nemorensis]